MTVTQTNLTQSLTLTEIAGSPSTETNTSQVRILWTSTQTGSSWNGYTRTAKYYVSINGGAETEYTVSYTLPLNTKQTILDTTVTVDHKDDGSGNIKVRVWMDTDISAGVFNFSEELTLTTIARASAINFAANVALGDACHVRWTPKSAAFRYKLAFSLNNWRYTTDAIHPNKTSEYTYTGFEIPLDVAYQFKTRDSVMTVTLYTYSDSSATVQVGSSASDTFKVTVPENDKTSPTVDMSLSPVSILSAPFNNLYIQGHSKVDAALTLSTKYGADVEASNIVVEGTTYGDPYVSEYLTQSGKQLVKGQVKDSRGHYGTIYKEIEVIPYSKPYVKEKSGESNIIAARCDSSANFTDSGTYLKIVAKVVYEKVISNGVQNNFGKLKFRYRKEGGSYSDWQTILDCKTDESDEVTTEPLLDGALDVKTNYQVQIIASDDLYDSVPITIGVPSDDVYMDRPAGGKSMGLGGYSSGDGNLDIYWKIKARGGLSMLNEAGEELAALGEGSFAFYVPVTAPSFNGVATEYMQDRGLCTDANTAYLTGMYRLNDSSVNAPSNNGLLVVLSSNAQTAPILQMAFNWNATIRKLRMIWYGTVCEWIDF